MELTGKCIESFWKWYFLDGTLRNLKRYTAHNLQVKIHGEKAVAVEKLRFLSLSESEQYGVIVDFADSVGVDIMIGIYGYDIKIKNECGERWTKKTGKNRHEVRTAAVKKFNEIFNERL